MNYKKNAIFIISKELLCTVNKVAKWNCIYDALRLQMKFSAFDR